MCFSNSLFFVISDMNKTLKILELTSVRAINPQSLINSSSYHSICIEDPSAVTFLNN